LQEIIRSAKDRIATECLGRFWQLVSSTKRDVRSVRKNCPSVRHLVNLVLVTQPLKSIAVPLPHIYGLIGPPKSA